jgi:hypothetical protein
VLAAAIIPAQIAYIEVVAGQKLVIRFWERANCQSQALVVQCARALLLVSSVVVTSIDSEVGDMKFTAQKSCSKLAV